MADRKSQTSLTSTPPLPDDVLDELVVQVRNQPTLYDTSHPNYGKTPARDECWDQIAENLEEVAGTRIPRNVLKSRWRNLRDAYIKLYRKEEAGIKMELQKRKADLMDSMRFLIPFVGKRLNLKDKTSKSTKTKFTVLRPKSRREPINYSENESSYGDYDYNSASYNGDDEKEVIQTIPDIIYDVEDTDENEVDGSQSGYYDQDTMMTDSNDGMIIPDNNQQDQQDLLNYIKVVNVSSLRDKEARGSSGSPSGSRTFQYQERTRSENLHQAAQSVMMLSENELFLLSMAKIMDQFPTEKQIEIRRQVHALVSAVQLKFANNR